MATPTSGWTAAHLIPNPGFQPRGLTYIGGTPAPAQRTSGGTPFFMRTAQTGVAPAAQPPGIANNQAISGWTGVPWWMQQQISNLRQLPTMRPQAPAVRPQQQKKKKGFFEQILNISAPVESAIFGG